MPQASLKSGRRPRPLSFPQQPPCAAPTRRLVARFVTCLQPERPYVKAMNDANKSTADESPATLHVRALFISDIHLVTRTARADLVLDLLRCCDADTIYLVGDIVDFWRIRRGRHLAPAHNDVLQKLLRKVRKGTRVSYPRQPRRRHARLLRPALRRYREFERARPARDARSTLCLVIHGDEFDVVVRDAKWLAFLGDRGYELALWLNRPLNWSAAGLGLGFWSLSAYLKHRVQDGRELHRRLRERWPTKRGAATSTASSAATSITPPPAIARRALSQYRRLGGELHCGDGIARRRDAGGAHWLERAPDPAAHTGLPVDLEAAPASADAAAAPMLTPASLSDNAETLRSVANTPCPTVGSASPASARRRAFFGGVRTQVNVRCRRACSCSIETVCAMFAGNQAERRAGSRAIRLRRTIH